MRIAQRFNAGSEAQGIQIRPEGTVEAPLPKARPRLMIQSSLRDEQGTKSGPLSRDHSVPTEANEGNEALAWKCQTPASSPSLLALISAD